MALSIKNNDADRLARELAETTGETLTEAICNALRERLEREKGIRNPDRIRDEISRIQKRVARLPKLDERSDEQILGYDKQGLLS